MTYPAGIVTGTAHNLPPGARPLAWLRPSAPAVSTSAAIEFGPGAMWASIDADTGRFSFRAPATKVWDGPCVYVIEIAGRDVVTVRSVESDVVVDLGVLDLAGS